MKRLASSKKVTTISLVRWGVPALYACPGGESVAAAILVSCLRAGIGTVVLLRLRPRWSMIRGHRTRSSTDAPAGLSLCNSIGKITSIPCAFFTFSVILRADRPVLSKHKPVIVFQMVLFIFFI